MSGVLKKLFKVDRLSTFSKLYKFVRNVLHKKKTRKTCFIDVNYFL